MNLLKAFYHKTRRQFVPMLAREIAAKAKVDPESAAMALVDFQRKGWVRGAKDPLISTAIWELTPAGQAKAMEIIHAEAMMRSV